MAINVQMNLLGDDGKYQVVYPQVNNSYYLEESSGQMDLGNAITYVYNEAKTGMIEDTSIQWQSKYTYQKNTQVGIGYIWVTMDLLSGTLKEGESYFIYTDPNGVLLNNSQPSFSSRYNIGIMSNFYIRDVTAIFNNYSNIELGANVQYFAYQNRLSVKITPMLNIIGKDFGGYYHYLSFIYTTFKGSI